MAEHPWSVPMRREEVPETGRRVELVADETVRDSVAKEAGVVGVERLSAVFDVTRLGHDGLRATGRVRATVRQTCVVSLEPMSTDLDEAIDVAFAPPNAVATGTELDFEPAPASGEPPEPLVNGGIDLGALATEFLILGIDPYPRKPDVTFEPPAVPDAGENPFAALAALKNASKVKD